MAVFKEYSPGYKKDGYYVHISIPGADHPIPLQTPDEIAEFYLSTGYEAGDQIPDQLVWALYELDLHWTGKGGISRSDASKPDGEPAPELAPEDVERIEKFVDSYTGEYAEDLERLVGRLEVSTESTANSDFDLQEVFDRTPPVNFSTVSEEFTRESKQRIQKWLPSMVMDEEDRKAVDERLDGEGFGKSPHDHLVDLLQTPDYESILDSHAAHPWTVSSVTVREDTVVGSTEDPDQPIFTAMYDEEQLSVGNVLSFTVQDLRLYRTPVDFELAVVTSNTEKIAVAISDVEIVDFTVTPGSCDTGRFDNDVISDFTAEYTDASEKTVTHSLAISFAHLLPEMLEYCNEIPDYDMASTDPDADYYEIVF
ncbi:hypothetical protein C456_03026 [Haloferax volcanii DSM 14919]|uniref:Uncharacterized protein n=1 Tax=Haloferax lucentense (strain DSM 14919 / JCM 9276 / NCIMB 13854 / Aa 2.2) TaxID=1230452 RepID=M0GYZ2_HALL2|nr:hypothetical protein [Haloferax lucentense]ELZ77476.1 hypothetical protein C456_03026 [Haloferax lucentense DSM 14919]